MEAFIIIVVIIMIASLKFLSDNPSISIILVLSIVLSFFHHFEILLVLPVINDFCIETWTLGVWHYENLDLIYNFCFRWFFWHWFSRRSGGHSTSLLPGEGRGLGFPIAFAYWAQGRVTVFSVAFGWSRVVIA